MATKFPKKVVCSFNNAKESKIQFYFNNDDDDNTNNNNNSAVKRLIANNCIQN